ncbi:MAG: SAM-dependent methyltransferase [Muribaculaceae bacterium]|nr:SAM-dependent methyltransferase [Muribaculaceae bacterium]
MEKEAALYLIPVGMSDAPYSEVIPAGNVEIIKRLRHFIVENTRSARRFLKRCDPAMDLAEVTFYELNRHTDLSEVAGYLAPLRRGESMGVMSDAGCPAVADPGALPVAIAQEEGLTVRPLVGPSSILMGIMASGFNGQGFSFHGYLPIDDHDRAAALKRLEEDSRRHSMTQIFIETPYRNQRMLEFLINHLSPSTRICVACDLTDPEREEVRTMTPAGWKKYLATLPEGRGYDKRPAVFLIYAGGKEDVQQTKKKTNRRKR